MASEKVTGQEQQRWQLWPHLRWTLRAAARQPAPSGHFARFQLLQTTANRLPDCARLASIHCGRGRQPGLDRGPARRKRRSVGREAQAQALSPRHRQPRRAPPGPTEARRDLSLSFALFRRPSVELSSRRRPTLLTASGGTASASSIFSRKMGGCAHFFFFSAVRRHCS